MGRRINNIYCEPPSLRSSERSEDNPNRISQEYGSFFGCLNRYDSSPVPPDELLLCNDHTGLEIYGISFRNPSEILFISVKDNKRAQIYKFPAYPACARSRTITVSKPNINVSCRPRQKNGLQDFIYPALFWDRPFLGSSFF